MLLPNPTSSCSHVAIGLLLCAAIAVPVRPAAAAWSSNNYTIVWTHCDVTAGNRSTAKLHCDGATINADLWLAHGVRELWVHFRLSAGSRRRQQERQTLFDGELNGCELLSGATFNPFVTLIYASILKAPNANLPRRCPIDKVCVCDCEIRSEQISFMYDKL